MGIYENVKNIVGKKFRDTTFRLFEEELHEYGYHTYWSVLNAKHYGIPQNRERVYLILIQKEMDNGKFQFPEPLESFQCLMDILEDTVEEKYYLSQEKVHRLIEDMEERKALLFEPDEKSLKVFRENRVKRAGNIKGVFEQTGRVYLQMLLSYSNCLRRWSQQPKILQVGDIQVPVMVQVEPFIPHWEAAGTCSGRA